jgi:hypothetical protein
MPASQIISLRNCVGALLQGADAPFTSAMRREVSFEQLSLAGGRSRLFFSPRCNVGDLSQSRDIGDPPQVLENVARLNISIIFTSQSSRRPGRGHMSGFRRVERIIFGNSIVGSTLSGIRAAKSLLLEIMKRLAWCLLFAVAEVASLIGLSLRCRRELRSHSPDRLAASSTG